MQTHSYTHTHPPLVMIYEKNTSKQTHLMYIPVCFYCLSSIAHLGCEWTGQPADHPGRGEQTATQLSGSQIMLEFSRGGFI